MCTFGKFGICHKSGIFLCSVQFITRFLGETSTIRIDIGLIDWTFVYLIGTGRAHDEEESIDGAAAKVFTGETERVGGILEEEGGWTLGFGDAGGAAAAAVRLLR
jgi:hypothetical protein